MMNLVQAINYGNKIGVKYLIKNSNGGLMGGTVTYEDAIKMKKEFEKELEDDPWNKDLKIFIEEK